MYLVVFVGGFVGVGFRRATDLLLPSVNGSPFVVGTFVSNMLACFLFAMLTEYMATASWAAPQGTAGRQPWRRALVCLADCRRCPA